VTLPAPAPLLFWLAAFWIAVAGHARRAPDGEGVLRLGLGLALGALLAHLGWALLHADAVARHPAALLDPRAGASVLFVPLGILLVALPAPRRERARFLAAALGSLPLALATARLGCVLAGCCFATPRGLPWALALGPDDALRHPTALYEIAGLLVLTAGVRAAPPQRAAALVLAGLGALRLVVQPFRSPPALGEPLVPASLLAAAWLALGLGLLLRAPRPRAREARAHSPPR